MKIVGSTTGGGLTSSCEQSNIGVTSWTPITSLPIALNSLAMVTLLGKAYVIGGYNAGPQTSVYMYNGTSWIARAAMSPGRDTHAALALNYDRALVCGGYTTAYVNTCVIYNASANNWTTAPAMTEARYGLNLVMSEGMLH